MILGYEFVYRKPSLLLPYVFQTILLSNHAILSTSHSKMGDKKGFLFLTDASYGNLSGYIFARQGMTKKSFTVVA